MTFFKDKEELRKKSKVEEGALSIVPTLMPSLYSSVDVFNSMKRVKPPDFSKSVHIAEKGVERRKNYESDVLRRGYDGATNQDVANNFLVNLKKLKV